MNKKLISAFCISAAVALYNYVDLSNYQNSQKLLLGSVEALADDAKEIGDQSKFDAIDCPQGNATQTTTTQTTNQQNNSQTSSNTSSNTQGANVSATASVKFLGSGGSASTGYSGSWTNGDNSSQTSGDSSSTTTTNVVNYSGEAHSVACIPNGTQYSQCVDATVHVKTAQCQYPGHFRI